MSIRIVFQMVVIKKSAVRKHYPDGEAGFRSTYPFAAEDRYLFGLGSMSGGELEEILQELTAAGFTAFLPERLPVNDAAIAFGQIVEAQARLSADPGRNDNFLLARNQ